jgi:3-hydroxy-3-methylglutaryl CoA synthase
MPSINATAIPIPTIVNDEMMISPINPSWAFDAQSPSFSTDTSSEEESTSSTMDPQNELFYRHRRSFRDFTRAVRLRQAARQHQENEPRAISPFETPESSSYCFSNVEDCLHTSTTNQYKHLSTYALSCYFLDFKVIYNDGGCFR